MIKRINEFLPNVKDYYLINDNGEVFSDNIQGRKLKERPTKKGYLRVMLPHLDGTQLTIFYKVKDAINFKFKVQRLSYRAEMPTGVRL